MDRYNSHVGRKSIDPVILGYTDIREYQNNAMKKGFHYEEEKDFFVCIQRRQLEFYKLIYKKAAQNYYQLYSRSKKQCKNCPGFAHV